MQFDFICHGSGAAFYHVFNAVAGFFNGTKFGGTVGIILCMSTLFAIVVVAYQLAMNLNLVISLRRLAVIFFLVNIISVPRATVIVKDRITLQQYTVANVPYVLAAMGGLTTQLGDVITQKFDMAFIPTRELSYGSSGIGMSSKIIEKASHFTITNPDVASNMNEFVKTCVIFNGIAKGRYTFKALFEQDDIWKFVAEHTTPRFGFLYKHPDGSKPEFMSCTKIAKKFDELWPTVLKEASTVYGQRIFAGNRSAAKQLANYLGVSYQYLTGLAIDASQILRQNMMFNAIQQGAIQGMAFHDASAGLNAYALTRAERTQETAWSLMGKLADNTLTPMKIVIEVLFYGIFPLIAILAPLPGGLSILKTYVIALFWIQSWGPLYAILNMILNVYGQHASVAAASMHGKAMLSLSTIGALGQANATVAAIASATVPMIPFLSFALFKYGAGALTQLAQTLTSASGSAVSAAADEVTTGRFSLATSTFDTHSMHNTSGFKHDTNASVRTGATTFQDKDGGMTTYNPDGQVVFDRTPAISRTGADLKSTGMIAASFGRGAEEAHRSALTDAVSMQNSVSSGLKKMHDYREARGSQFASDSSYSQRDSFSSDSAMAKTDDLVESFARENNINASAARSVLSSVAVSSSVGMKIPGTDIGFSGQTSLKTDDGRSINVQEIMNKAVRFNESTHFSETMRAATEEAKMLNERTGQSEGKDYLSGMSADFSNAQAKSDSSNASLSKEKAYRETANYVESQGVSVAQDLNQVYANTLFDKYGVDGARRIMADPLQNSQHLSEFVDSHRDQLLAKYQQDASPIATEQAIEKNYEQNKAAIEASADVDAEFVNKSKSVQEKAESAGLNEILQPNLQGKVDKNIQNANSKISKDKAKLIDKKSQAFTKQVQEQNEITKKILD